MAVLHHDPFVVEIEAYNDITRDELLVRSKKRSWDVELERRRCISEIPHAQTKVVS